MTRIRSGVDGPATSGRLRLLRTNQPGGRRSQSRPYSKKSNRSRASFTILSHYSPRVAPHALSPKSDRDPTASPDAPVVGNHVPDMIGCPSPEPSNSFPSGTFPSPFHTPCAGSNARPAASRSKPCRGLRASTYVVMSSGISSHDGPAD